MDEIREENRGLKRGPQCHCCQLVRGETGGLDYEMRADLDSALRDRGITARAIVAVMARHGVEISTSKVENHRRQHLGPVPR